MDNASLESAIGQFEATEANIKKLESLWKQIRDLIGEGVAFGSPPGYDEACRGFRHILSALPSINGYRAEDCLLAYNHVAQMRFDATELGELEVEVSVRGLIERQGEVLDEYRFRLATKRRELVRARVTTLVDDLDDHVRLMAAAIDGDPADEATASECLTNIDAAVTEIGILLGSATKPPRWDYLRRHIHFG